MQLLNRDDTPSSIDPTAVLRGDHVELRPLEREHGQLLQPWFDEDPETFSLMLGTPHLFDGDATRFCDWLLEHRRAGHASPWSVFDRATGTYLGYTRFLHVDLTSRTTHIGGTWYAPNARGTNVNPECKLLLLGHAFEDCMFNRVQIQTDVTNERSMRAIAGIGAMFEGINRANYIAVNGTPRDTAVYSIIRSEWPQVRQGLRRRLTPS